MTSTHTPSILVVCTGNICRSAMAEVVLADRAHARGLDVAGDLEPQRGQMPARGVGDELRARDARGDLEGLDGGEPGVVDPHRMLADRVRGHVDQASLDVLTRQLVALTVQGEPNRRTALTAHGQKLRHSVDTRGRFSLRTLVLP